MNVSEKFKIAERLLLQADDRIYKLEVQLAALAWARWIPVGERLPDTYDSVIVAYRRMAKDGTPDKRYTSTWVEMSFMRLEGYWNIVDRFSWPCVVVAWMPLPPAPATDAGEV